MDTTPNPVVYPPISNDPLGGARPADVYYPAGFRNVTSAPANETEVESYPQCRGGVGVELWTVRMGSHVPELQDAFAEQTLDFLFQYDRTR
ncbi:MAG: hypothetical protein AAF658_01580 [Myxococcota bacterium]